MNESPLPNSSIAHYRIVSKIGAGGMGEVFLAEDAKLGRRVALKILPDSVAADAERLSRFEREAQAASALNHPNILTVHEIGEDGGVRFITSEFVEGKTLRELINTVRVPLAEVVDIIIQAASALHAAHEAGIVHRDIKPENLMLRSDGYVKVLDFGLAKVTHPAFGRAGHLASEDAIQTQVQTRAGTIVGTAAYMSPEQTLAGQVDARTDIFSLGVVLYELLAGRHPFMGSTLSHTVVAILEKQPPPFGPGGTQVPEELSQIVFRALEKKVENRYQTASEFCFDLKSFIKRLEFRSELERTFPPDRISEMQPPSTGSNLTALAAAPGNTIAVLPFANMGRGEEGDYFSDGLAEELLNVLSKIRGLRVAARTSAFSFKGKSATVAEIGRVLNVASVLEGSIRTAGERVRISVQLVSVADGFQLWSETYNRTMDDIFAVQDDIAKSVVEELRTRLLGEAANQNDHRISSEVAAAVRGRADDPEAQRLMLLGRHFLDRTTREDTAQAVKYFREALDIDPGYALCWAELGRAYSIEAGRGWIPVSEGFDRSRDAAKRALAFEPDLPEGHAQLGRIQVTHDWDFPQAEASYRRALELAPGSSSVLDGAAVLAYKLGRLDEALRLGREVLARDPLSAAFWHNLGLTCHAAGLSDESAKAFRRALELAPRRIVSNALLALVLMEQGRGDEAAEQASREPDEFWRTWALAMIDYSAGKGPESDRALAKLIEEHAEGNAYQIAEVYSTRGDLDNAFRWLNRTIDERDPGATHAKVNPRFAPLREDPRWPALLERIGF